MKRFIAFMLIFGVILLASCTAVGQKEAEARAVAFVNKNVKFYSKDLENNSQDVRNYEIDSIDSYQQDGNWIVIMHVVSEENGREKKNDLTVEISQKGDVIQLNGQKVPE
jgi:uncharacterized protein YxeA